jgi:hypothetical protein
MMLVRVVAAHFVAGFVFDGDKCVRAAPILKWCVGKSADYIRGQFRAHGWRASIVEVFDEG